MRFEFSYKKALLIIGFVLCMIPQSVVAQSEKPKNLLLYDNQPYHFGFIIGLNRMSYSINCKENYQLAEHPSTEFVTGDDDINFSEDHLYNVRSITPIPQYGFTVGVVGNLRLGKYFDLRLIPSLSFGTRSIEYHIMDVGTLEYQSFTKSIFSTFMEFPLHVKYRSKRMNNVAAYIIAGGNFKLDLASQKKDKAEKGQIKNIKVKKTDIAAEIGAGFDFYTGYFKLGVEVKMSYGLLNIMDSQNLIYDSSIKNIHNKTFQVSLTFE